MFLLQHHYYYNYYNYNWYMSTYQTFASYHCHGDIMYVLFTHTIVHSTQLRDIIQYYTALVPWCNIYIYIYIYIYAVLLMHRGMWYCFLHTSWNHIIFINNWLLIEEYDEEYSLLTWLGGQGVVWCGVMGSSYLKYICTYINAWLYSEHKRWWQKYYYSSTVDA
jgi:hypothetical protein